MSHNAMHNYANSYRQTDKWRNARYHTHQYETGKGDISSESRRLVLNPWQDVKPEKGGLHCEFTPLSEQPFQNRGGSSCPKVGICTGNHWLKCQTQYNAPLRLLLRQVTIGEVAIAFTARWESHNCNLDSYHVCHRKWKKMCNYLVFSCASPYSYWSWESWATQDNVPKTVKLLSAIVYNNLNKAKQTTKNVIELRKQNMNKYLASEKQLNIPVLDAM